MSKSNIPDLNTIAYKLYIDGAWVGNVSMSDYKKLISDKTPKFLSVAVYGTDNKFSSTAMVNSERVSWLQPINLKPSTK